jgi:hypothetical protein
LSKDMCFQARSSAKEKQREKAEYFRVDSSLARLIPCYIYSAKSQKTQTKGDGYICEILSRRI